MFRECPFLSYIEAVKPTDRIIPSRGLVRCGLAAAEGTGAELVCMAVAQVLLRNGDERH